MQNTQTSLLRSRVLAHPAACSIIDLLAIMTFVTLAILLLLAFPNLMWFLPLTVFGSTFLIFQAKKLFAKLGSLQGEVEALTEENRMLKLTEASAKIGHWRVNFADDQLFWSDQTFEIHGLPRGSTPSLSDAINAFHPDDRSNISDAVESARRTGNPYRFRARLIRPDGSVRHTESVAQVEVDKDGQAKAIFGTFADRTSEEATTQKLRLAQLSAEKARDAKSEFLAKMSHEIRTPMNAVVGFADLLLSEKLSAAQREKVEVIAASGRSLTCLLKDILDLTRIEAGQVSVTKRPFDIRLLVDEVVQLYHYEACEKGLEIRTSIETAVDRTIMGDALRIRQIISNLLSNAIKFSTNGTIEVNVFRIETALFFEVADSGCGMPPSFQEQCFEPFSQSTISDSGMIAGTGLGLNICRQLSRLMGGDITVRSKEGQGSAFQFDIPLITVANEACGISSDEVLARRRDAKILLAEDFEINQMLIAAMAEKLGIELVLASDGQEALDAVLLATKTNRNFDLILMDLQMPRLNGYEACRAIRDSGFSSRELPIVALSANAYPEDVERCIQAGMQDHIAKPIDFEIFAHTIDSALAGFSNPEYR